MRIEYVLQILHDLDFFVGSRIVQEIPFEKSHAVLGRDAAFSLLD